jgi:hypothetical protein
MEDLETTKPYKVPEAEKIPVSPAKEEPKPEKKKDKVWNMNNSYCLTYLLRLIVFH